MEEVESLGKHCEGCEKLIPEDARFCRYCGASQRDLAEELQEAEGKKWLKLVGIFYGIDLVICAIVNFVHFFRGLEWLIITDVVIACITLLFLAFTWKNIQHLFQWKGFTVPKLMVYSITAVLFAIGVNLFVRWLNKNIYDQDVYFYYSFGHLAYPKLTMIVIIALLPAIFEELAYRGIILHGLLHVLDEKQAIFVSAFLFALIHMSFISFFWLLPFAIWLGNIRWKENTIWWGVVIHFCFNATACLLEFYQLKLY
jgi:membrane protease YdiL (CAAX protease family)